jgi:hypothetical protein
LNWPPLPYHGSALPYKLCGLFMLFIFFNEIIG